MVIRDLSNTPPAAIVDCLLVAFENYYVKMPSDQDYWMQRWQGARVDYALSAGVFEDDKLVGFILHGIDKDNNGEIIAFNCATGILPQQRRKGLVRELYNFLMPQLKEAGVRKCGLEVITKNNVAKQSYEKVGFEVVKEYKSFFGQLKAGEKETPGYELVKSSVPVWERYSAMKACEFSWENNMRALIALPANAFETWELVNDGSLAGYAILKPNGHIVQFGTTVHAELETLFDKLAAKVTGNVRIINIDEKEKELTGFLLDRGLANTIDQYYMEYHVN